MYQSRISLNKDHRSEPDRLLMKKTLCALLLSVIVLAGVPTITFAQSATEKLDGIAENTDETNSMLTDIQAALEELTAALLSLSDNVGSFDSRISNLELKLDEVASDTELVNQETAANQTLPAIPESLADINNQLHVLRQAIRQLDTPPELLADISEQLNNLMTEIGQLPESTGDVQSQSLMDINEQINDLRAEIGQLPESTAVGPMQGMHGGSTNMPVSVYAKSGVVFESPLAVDGDGRSIDLVKDNALVGIVVPRITDYMKEEVSPALNDAPIIFHYLTLLYNAAFDAVAPYHTTAVGVYSRIEHRPAYESETNLYPNTAVMHASYRMMLEFAPHRADEWRDMMTSYGLDPDNNSGLDLDCSQTHALDSPAAIGNHAAKCVLDARSDDGLNHFGTENIPPFGDTTGYQPVNTPGSLVDPSRWSPLVAINRFGELGTQNFATPQWANTESYSGLDPRSYRVPPPLSSNHRNAEAYQAQADQIIALRANLTGDQKILIEFFDNKLRELTSMPALKNIHDVVEYTQLEFLLAISKFDAGTIIWQEKARYDAVRPTTAIHYLYGDETVPLSTDTFGIVLTVPGTQWKSYLQTADHPEYPSATTCFCAAYAEAWRLYSGTDDLPTYVNGDETIYGYDVTFPAHSSLIEPWTTPSEDVHVVFDSWSDFEQRCAASRVISGTHFWPAVEVSVDTCNVAANVAFTYWETLIHGTAPSRGPAESMDPDPMLVSGPSWTGY